MTGFDTPERWRNVDRLNTRFIFADDRLRPDDYMLLVSTQLSDVTVTLPPASSVPGMQFVVKKLHPDGVVLVLPTSGDLIDLTTFFAIYGLNDVYTFLSSDDGSNWYVTGTEDLSVPNVVLTGADYTATLKDDVIACNPIGVQTITLPDAANAPGKTFFVKKLSNPPGDTRIVTASGEPFDLLPTQDRLYLLNSGTVYSSLSQPGLGYVRLANYTQELITITIGGEEVGGNNRTEIPLQQNGVDVDEGNISFPYDVLLASFKMVTGHDSTDPGDWDFDWTVYDETGAVVSSGSIPCIMDNSLPARNLTVQDIPGEIQMLAASHHMGATFTGPGVRNPFCAATLTFARV